MRIFAQKPKAIPQTTCSKSTKPSRTFLGQSLDVQSIPHLQRTIGNQAVMRLLQTATENMDANSASNSANSFFHDFSHMPIYPGSRNTIHPKLKVNAPKDRYEQEADRIADKVLLQKAPDEEDEKLDLQAKPSLPAAGAERGVSKHLENRLNRSIGSGNPLWHVSQSFFEAHMRHDFSNVRVHADSEAAQMSRELGARAFTYGHDIYFGAGQYNPQSRQGEHLLAHELTHVVQQEKEWQMPLPPGTHMTSGNYRIQREISTPLDEYVKKVPKDESAKFKIGDVSIEVRQDIKSKKVKETGGKTTFKIEWGFEKVKGKKGKLEYQFPKYKLDKNGKVTKIVGTIPKARKLIIQSTYGTKALPEMKSAYGRGTTKADIKAGKTTLRFHEGSHGTDFIKFVKDNPPPEFQGKVGMKEADYVKAMADYNKQIEQYEKKMEEHTKIRTDCIGTKADFCEE